MKNLDTLIEQLDALEAELPAMVAQYPNEGDFWAAFAGQSDVIEDAAGSHAIAVGERIEEILAKHGYAKRLGGI